MFGNEHSVQTGRNWEVMIIASIGDQGRPSGQERKGDTVRVLQTYRSTACLPANQEERVSKGPPSEGNDGPSKNGGNEDVGGRGD
jgi:hypothetical protein